MFSTRAEYHEFLKTAVERVTVSASESTAGAGN